MIDAHCHLQFDAFDELSPFSQLHTWSDGSPHPPINGYIVADYDSKRRAKLLELNRREDVWISAGIHPWALSSRAHRNETKWQELEAFIDEHHQELIAIGECGLDTAIRQGAEFETQVHWLMRHIELSKSYDLPLILHLVGGHETVIDYLTSHPDDGLRIFCHGFSGTPEQARRLSDLGCLISVGGDLLRHRGRTIEVCKQLGLDRLAIETDSPSRCPDYLEPPMRPAYLSLVASKLSEILNTDIDTVDAVTERNTRNFFRL